MAHLQAASTAQAPDNSNKADDTSPFATLLRAQTTADAKSQKDASAGDTNDPPPQTTEPPVPTQPPAKPAKSDKAVDDKSASTSIPADSPPPPDPSSIMTTPPLPVPPPPKAADDTDDHDTDVQAAIAPAPKANIKPADTDTDVITRKTDVTSQDASKPTTAEAMPKAPSQAQPVTPNPDQSFTATAPSSTQQAHPTQAAHHIEITTQPQPDIPALAVQIAAKSQSGIKQFDIRLDPPELGRVEVRLSIDDTGKTCAHLSADQPQTLDLLQKDAPTLTRALRDAGLELSQGGLNFSLRQQTQNQDQSATGHTARSRTILAATDTATITTTTSAYRAPLIGRLDIRV